MLFAAVIGSVWTLLLGQADDRVVWSCIAMQHGVGGSVERQEKCSLSLASAGGRGGEEANCQSLWFLAWKLADH